MINMFESKTDAHRYIVKLKESDFPWLEQEYARRKEEYRKKFGVNSFEKFADVFIKDIFEKLNSAKKRFLRCNELVISNILIKVNYVIKNAFY